MRHSASAILALLTLTAGVPALAQTDVSPPPAIAAAAAVDPDSSVDDAAEQARDVYLILVGEIAAQSGQAELASRELLLHLGHAGLHADRHGVHRVGRGQGELVAHPAQGLELLQRCQRSVRRWRHLT